MTVQSLKANNKSLEDNPPIPVHHKFILPPWMRAVLNNDGAVIFIDGRKEKGKTDFALKLAEYCFENKLRMKIATNIKTDSYMVEKQITNYPDLERWLKEPGRKVFILDEAGKILGKTRFMTQLSKVIMDIIQLIRHFDCIFIGIAPDERFIDSNFMGSEILDMRIKKKKKTEAKVRDLLHRKSILLTHIRGTSIKFDSKDIADFNLEKPIDKNRMMLCCQVASLYGEGKSYKEIKEALIIHHDEQVRQLLIKHAKHTTAHKE